MKRWGGLAALLAIGVSGCSSPSASGDNALSAEECRAYYVHTYQLDGMDAVQILGEDVLSQDSRTCSEQGSVTRRHYDCAMAATSVDQLPACGTPNT